MEYVCRKARTESISQSCSKYSRTSSRYTLNQNTSGQRSRQTQKTSTSKSTAEYQPERVGYGNTTTLAINAQDNDIVLCFTNKATQNIRVFYVRQLHLLAHKLGNDILGNTSIHVDEFIMVPNKQWRRQDFILGGQINNLLLIQGVQGHAPPEKKFEFWASETAFHALWRHLEKNVKVVTQSFILEQRSVDSMNRCTQDTQHCLLTIFQPPLLNSSDLNESKTTL